MVPTPFFADVEAGTLVRSLLIAVVIVLPFGYVKLRQVRAAREAAGLTSPSTPAAPPPRDPNSLETVVDRITSLAGVGGEAELPDRCTVDGQPVDASVVAVLVGDALGRSGLQETRRVHRDGITTLHLEPAPSDGPDHPVGR